jgi:hypothetical protein
MQLIQQGWHSENIQTKRLVACYLTESKITIFQPLTLNLPSLCQIKIEREQSYNKEENIYSLYIPHYDNGAVCHQLYDTTH